MSECENKNTKRETRQYQATKLQLNRNTIRETRQYQATKLSQIKADFWIKQAVTNWYTDIQIMIEQNGIENMSLLPLLLTINR